MDLDTLSVFLEAVYEYFEEAEVKLQQRQQISAAQLFEKKIMRG